MRSSVPDIRVRVAPEQRKLSQQLVDGMDAGAVRVPWTAWAVLRDGGGQRRDHGALREANRCLPGLGQV